MRAWIRIVDESQAQGELKTEYEEVRRTRGRVSNVMKVHSLDPKAMRLHLDLYLHLMFGKSTVTRAQREMIAVVVSRLNSCRYCVIHHGEALLQHVHDKTLLENLERDPASAGLSAKDVAMLRYAAKLTRSPGEVSEADVEQVRSKGFTDEEILRINLITSYFSFANRVVSGLGIPLETIEDRVYRY